MIRFLQTPGKFQKFLIAAFVIVIGIMMVITLIPGGFMGNAFGFGGPEGNVLAKVGDQEVTLVEVQQTARRIGRQQFSRGVPSAFMPFLIQRAADNLILQRAMISEANRMGFKVTDEDLRDELQRGVLGPQLFPQGQFIGRENYELFAQSNDMTVPQFEEAMKSDLLLRKLRHAVEGGVTVSDNELQREFTKENTKVKFEYAVLTSEELAKQVHLSEAELKAFYEKNKQAYANTIPEKRKVRYVVIDANKVPNAAGVSREDLQRYYQQHQDDFRVPEEVNVRHILIKTPVPGPDGKVDPKAVETAKAKAEDVRKQLKAGKPFAELAAKFSEDTASAKRGGMLGWIGRGRTVPEFEKAAFTLPKGQVSDVVRSSFGFHIIQVDDKHEPHMKSLDEVKAQIEPILAREKNTKAAESLANELLAEARTQGLEKAAAKHGLTMTTSGMIAQADLLPGVGTPDFTQAVFSQRDKSLPELARTQNGFAIYQVTEIKPPSTPTFEEARDRLERDLKTQRAQSMLGQKTQELSDRARAEHNLQKAAKEVGATLKTSELVSMASQVPELGSMSGPGAVAFGLKSGEISVPINTGSGGAVLQVLEKQEPAANEFEARREQLRESVLRRKREEMFEVFALDLRQRMQKQGKIRVNEKELKRITTPTKESGM
jgi:peptidyl-prolyl cis-trans isomerase D